MKAKDGRLRLKPGEVEFWRWLVRFSAPKRAREKAGDDRRGSRKGPS